MQPILGYFGFLKAAAKEFRLIAYDNCNWGLNTRTYESPAITDPEAAEKWILEFHEKTIDHLDMLAPGDKFYLAGHSHGGYQVSLYASQHPERIEKLFLLSPAGT